MKKGYILLFLFFFMPLVSACQYSQDDYAVEFVLNKNLNLNKLALAKNILIDNEEYIIQSQFNKNLAVIISKNTDFTYDIRMQIPVETKQITVPYLVTVSNIQAKTNLTEKREYYHGWTILSDGTTLEAKKQNVLINVNSLKNSYEVELTIYKTISSCNECDGSCIYSSYGNACINKEVKQDIEDVLKHLEIAPSFDVLLISYKVIIKGEKTINDLVPVVSGDIDLKQALKDQLVWFSNKGIINLDTEEIDEITKLAEKGTAGNSRIVSEENNYIYYYESKNAVINTELNCNEFLFSNIPKNLPTMAVIGISNYYLIPIVLFVVFLAVFLILIIVARVSYSRKEIKR